MTDIVDRLRRTPLYYGSGETSSLGEDAADVIERLRAALKSITDHFADVMGGPLVAATGVVFKNGIEGIPTIARAREELATLEDVIRDEIRTTLEAREQARGVKK